MDIPYVFLAFWYLISSVLLYCCCELLLQADFHMASHCFIRECFPICFVKFSQYGEIFQIQLWMLVRSLCYVTHNSCFRDKQLSVCWPRLLIDNFYFGLRRVWIVMARCTTARKWNLADNLYCRFWIQYVVGIPYVVWEMASADDSRSRHFVL